MCLRGSAFLGAQRGGAGLGKFRWLLLLLWLELFCIPKDDSVQWLEVATQNVADTHRRCHKA